MARANSYLQNRCSFCHHPSFISDMQYNYCANHWNLWGADALKMQRAKYLASCLPQEVYDALWQAAKPTTGFLDRFIASLEQAVQAETERMAGELRTRMGADTYDIWRKNLPSTTEKQLLEEMDRQMNKLEIYHQRQEQFTLTGSETV